MRRLTFLSLLGFAISAAQAQLPAYQPATRIEGVIHVWGSPQMSSLLTLYENSFRRLQPGVHFVNELNSTLTAVPGVYTGRADIGLLGREIWQTERAAFSATLGQPPAVVEIATGAYDVPKATFALMIFVSHENPVASLSLPQLQKVFGTKAGEITQLRTWGDLGLTGIWAKRPVHLYGFKLENDKSMIFSDMVFEPGIRWSSALNEFDNTTKEDAGQRIVDAVAADLEGIGISNIHYATAAVRAVPLAPREDEPAVTPSRANVAQRRYPLTRSVFMVTAPVVSPATLEFLRYVTSRQGAAEVVREGEYLPLLASPKALPHTK